MTEVLQGPAELYDGRGRGRVRCISTPLENEASTESARVVPSFVYVCVSSSIIRGQGGGDEKCSVRCNTIGADLFIACRKSKFN